MELIERVQQVHLENALRWLCLLLVGFVCFVCFTFLLCLVVIDFL